MAKELEEAEKQIEHQMRLDVNTSTRQHAGHVGHVSTLATGLR